MFSFQEDNRLDYTPVQYIKVWSVFFPGGRVVALTVSIRKPTTRFMPPPLRMFSRRHQTWFHCTKTWSFFLHGGHFVALTMSPLGTIWPHQFNRRAHKQKEKVWPNVWNWSSLLTSCVQRPYLPGTCHSQSAFLSPFFFIFSRYLMDEQ